MHKIISRPPHDDFSMELFNQLYKDRKKYKLENAHFTYLWSASVCMDDSLVYKVPLDKVDIFDNLFNSFFKIYASQMAGVGKFFNTKKDMFNLFIRGIGDEKEKALVKRNFMEVRDKFYLAYDTLQNIVSDKPELEMYFENSIESKNMSVFFVKDHFRIRITDAWTNPVPEISEYLSNMCEHYPDKKFVIVTSLENLDKEINQPNVIIIPMGGDITNQYIQRHDRIPVTEKNMESEKYYIALNRGPRAHRIYTVSALYGYEIEQYGHITYLSTKPKNTELKDYIGFSSNDELHDIAQYGYSRFISIAPDSPTSSMNIYKNMDNDNIFNYNNCLVDLYKNSFVEIVSETSYNELSFNVTEKIQNCIYGANFPLIVSSPGYVEFMRQMGIDMFDDIIDHSYDKEPDPAKRIHKMITDNIELLTTDKAKRLWVENKHRFIQNQDYMNDKFYDMYTERFWNAVSDITNLKSKITINKVSMNYYFLFRPLFPHRYGIIQVSTLLKVHLSNFIDYTEFSSWFKTSEFSTTMENVNQIFDLGNTPEFKTISLIMNPYAKMFVCYLQELRETNPGIELDTVEQIRIHASVESFQEFLDVAVQRDIEIYKMNVVEQTELDSVKPSHVLRIENLAEDLKSIPELSNIDTKLIDDVYPILSIYQEFYTDEAKEYVGHLYAKDLARYGYSF